MREKLPSDQIDARLEALSGWKSDGAKILKTFEFSSYKDGLVFACAVGYLADALDHHPDITIGYRRVLVTSHTHDAGGITEFDFRLAAKIESL